MNNLSVYLLSFRLTLDNKTRIAGKVVAIVIGIDQEVGSLLWGENQPAGQLLS